jgi:hypothetical protein
LSGRGAGKAERARHELGKLDAVELKAVVGGQPVEQVVAIGALLAHGKRDGDRVLLDGLVRGFATDALRTEAINTLVVARNGR